MSDAVRVSVVIPLLDDSAPLESTLESALLQNYDSFEVVVCDGTPSGTAGEVCGGYARRGRDLTYLRLEGARGPAAVFAAALEGSAASYVVWLVRDSRFMRSDAIACLAAYLDQHPEVAVCANALSLQASSEASPRDKRYLFDLAPQRVERLAVRSLIRAGGDGAYAVHGMYRRSALAGSHNRLRVRAVVTDWWLDQSLLIDLLHFGKIVALPDPLLAVPVFPGGTAPPATQRRVLEAVLRLRRPWTEKVEYIALALKNGRPGHDVLDDEFIMQQRRDLTLHYRALEERPVTLERLERDVRELSTACSAFPQQLARLEREAARLRAMDEDRRATLEALRGAAGTLQEAPPPPRA